MSATEPAETTLIADLARRLPDDVPWLLRETDDSDTVRLLVGDRPGLLRGTLDGQGYTVRESDVPIHEDWAVLLEVRNG